MTRRFAAVDLGASGGRVIVGSFEDQRIVLDEAHRFANGIVERGGHLRWDLTALHRHVLAGLDRVGEVESIGIDTWGVDYGLLDGEGQLLAEPIAYRDDRTTKVIDDVHRRLAPDELYRINGLQHLPFNTIYQLAAERTGPLWDRARYVVLVPDLLAYWLTGELRSELTDASTTGLLDVTTRRWSELLLDRLDIPADLLPELQTPGELRGHTESGIRVVSVGSHDTASAVVGVPATTEHFAYVACGTWSLVGLELDAPVLTDEAFAASFTNELGVDGRVRFLRNVGGLWLLQECMRTWGRDDLELLLGRAARRPPGGPVIDVEDAAFIAPGDMPKRIADAAGSEMAPAGIVRCILDSLADAYARRIHQAEALAGRQVEVVHLVGGGAQNQLLCQLTANACHLPVVAGPVEATAIGNLAVQARAAAALPESLEAIRAAIAASSQLQRYVPS
jgi:rhamnulokinase